jgi:hypothetical protein
VKVTNNFGLPVPLVEAVRNDSYTNSGTLSVTTLIKPPQAVAIERKFSGEISEDASDRIWALLGQATHSILERAAQSLGPDYVVEERFFATVEGEKVSGQCDILHIPSKRLSDYKVTSAWAAKEALSGGKNEWTLQLSMLAVLARIAGYEVDSGEIVAILKDWSQSKASEEARRARQFGQQTDYPQANVVSILVPLMSDEETREWMRERVRQHVAARNGEVIPCTDEERWCQPGAFAVYKGENKRASKVEPTRAALDAWLLPALRKLLRRRSVVSATPRVHEEGGSIKWVSM